MDVEMNLPLGTGPARSGSALADRAAIHHALGEPHRLAIVDALRLSDRTPTELAAVTGLASNLLAFHLDVLEAAGVVRRSASHGDARRRYVRLRTATLARLEVVPHLAADDVLFVCTANSARSQLAAALWRGRTGRDASSAGDAPAVEVHPLALATARGRGLDLEGARPRGYDEVVTRPDLVVSVCDRARERGVPFDAPALHWSVPDPVGGGPDAFERAADELARRIDHLAAALAA
jgi:ArsR family transcriptional regulator, arsenate/arsenite/antimonite-responsive transcriptional repressor / arsenate reductase (thioredoxin)